MIILLIKFVSILIDTLIGVIWKWWGRKELKEYYVGQSRLVRDLIPWLIYLDLTILLLIYATCPRLWNILVVVYYLVWGFLSENLHTASERYGALYPDYPQLLFSVPVISTRAQKVLDNIANGGMIARNGGRSMVNMFIWMCAPLIVHWRRSWVQNIVHYTKWCSHHLRSSGIKHLVLYLKASQVLLQQSVGGYIIPSTLPLKVSVARTRGGLPRLIPPRHRALIRARDPQVIRFWMTLLGLYRVLSFPGKLDLSSITSPGVELTTSFMREWQHFISDVFWPQVRLMMGMRSLKLTAVVAQATTPIVEEEVPEVPPVGDSSTWGVDVSGMDPAVLAVLQAIGQYPAKLSADFTPRKGLSPFFRERLRAVPFLIQKSSPTVPTSEGGSQLVSTSFPSIWAAWWGFTRGEAGKFIRTTRSLYETFAIWTGIHALPIEDFDESKEFLQGRDPSELTTIPLGKLGLKEEAAGKVRVFAMVDALTQWLLRPLHDHLFRTFSKWKEDGTFDQHRPVKRLIRRKTKGLYSYDLSAATDRLPISLQIVILEPVLGPLGASMWADLLVGREYILPKSKLNPSKKTLVYAVGQPMGALSSWAMLALTHHAIVQYSYWLVCKQNHTSYKWFTDYAVLGDDLILGCREVAQTYLKVMASLGVGIGLAKSIVSHRTRTGEFAKRFYIPNDCSMVPLKEAIAARYNWAEMISFVRKYRMRPSQVLGFNSLGYRAKARLNASFASMSPRTRNLLLSLRYPKGPFGVSKLSDWLRLTSWNSMRKISDSRTLQALRDLGVKSLDDSLAAYTLRIDELKAQTKVMSLLTPNIYGPRLQIDVFFIEIYLRIQEDLDAIDVAIDELKTCKPSWKVPKEILRIEGMIGRLPKPPTKFFDVRPSEQINPHKKQVIRYMKFRNAVRTSKGKG